MSSCKKEKNQIATHESNKNHYDSKYRKQQAKQKKITFKEKRLQHYIEEHSNTGFNETFKQLSCSLYATMIYSVLNDLLDTKMLENLI